MQKKKKNRITAREFDYVLDRKMKASDLGRQYTHAITEFQARNAIQAGSLARNYQIQYGKMLESINRLPVPLRGPTVERLNELGSRLDELKRNYPSNFPRGPMPRQNEELARRRLVT